MMWAAHVDRDMSERNKSPYHHSPDLVVGGGRFVAVATNHLESTACGYVL